MPHDEWLERSGAFDISGGSWGAQLGGQEVDLVIVVMDDKGMHQLGSGRINLGTEASVTAGPVGNSDMKMNADVLSYSRARGAFAGINIQGSTITEDEGDSRILYGSSMSLADIFGAKHSLQMQAHRFCRRFKNTRGWPNPKTDG